MSTSETYRPAFDEPPGTTLAGISLSHLELPTPYVSYGLPYHEACVKHIENDFLARRIYIVASRSLAANTDNVDKLVAAIGQERVVGIRNGISPHSPFSEILSIAKECRDMEADCVVTVGAGSITDGCKLVVFALANNISTPEQLLQYSYESKHIPSDVHTPTVTLITIPTSLSGGEYFSLAGGTDDVTHHKTGFLHSGMGSKLIILDPELCLTTPEYHWLSTGVRSLDHCVEALCSLDATSKSDSNAEKGLRLLAPSLLKCKKDPNDVEARRDCQLAVIFAMGSVRAGIPMGGSHAIGHQLGPLGVPHGITSCIMCSGVMKYNIRHGGDKPEIARRQGRIRDILWSDPAVSNELEVAGLHSQSAGLGDTIDGIVRVLGLPRTLTELDIKEDVLPGLSERTLADFWAAQNPVPLVDAQQVMEILKAVV